jgi:hypothetical protein
VPREVWGEIRRGISGVVKEAITGKEGCPGEGSQGVVKDAS